MIVDDFDLVGMWFSPFKANAPLCVDSNAVLTISAAVQCFKAIAGRVSQIAQETGGVDGPQFTKCGAFNRVEPLASFAMKDSFRFDIVKTLDHTSSVSRKALPLVVDERCLAFPEVFPDEVKGRRGETTLVGLHLKFDVNL